MPHDPWKIWQRFLNSAGRPRDYEPLEPAPHAPLELYRPETSPRRFLYFTKPALVRAWLAAGKLPARVAIAVRAGIPSRSTLTLLSELSTQWDVPVTFIGDLRPYDLTIYSVLRYGDPSLRRRRGWNLKLQYGGINDPWLALSRASFRKEIQFEHLLIRMTAPETRHLEALEGILPDMERVIGAEALHLLRSGLTFHLEGACNPAVYRRGFIPALTQLLTASRRGSPSRKSSATRPARPS